MMNLLSIAKATFTYLLGITAAEETRHHIRAQASLQPGLHW